MEERIAKDALERELKRLRADIDAIENDAWGQEASSTLLVEELLLNSPPQLHDHAFSTSEAIKWDLPLPVPNEMESASRLAQLLDVCEAVFSGLRLSPTKRLVDNTWELSGEAGMLAFTVEFQTLANSISNFKLTRFPSEYAQEIAPLVRLATSRSCLRTWLVGLSEYGFLVAERASAFAEIMRRAPDNATATTAGRDGLEFTPRHRADITLRLEWKAKFTCIAVNMYEPNEFLLPEIKLSVVRGRSSLAAEEVELMEDGEALSGLIRAHGGGGVESAVLALIQAQ